MSTRNTKVTSLEIIRIPIEKIRFHEKNGELFEKRSPEYVTNLATDIKGNGLREPVSVRYLKETDVFLCLSGEHRVKAVRSIGWTEIPAYLVSPKNDLEFLISCNILNPRIGHKERVRIFKLYCPEFFTCEKITIKRLSEISVATKITIATLKSDLKKIRTGSTKDETMQAVIDLWAKKKIKGLRVNLCGLPDGAFILKVSGRNLNYEWKGKFKTVIKECIEAAKSDYFNKNFKNENLETAERIKQLRKDAGLTQFQLSQALGYSQSYFAELESGKWQCSNSLFESIAIFCQERAA
ncbi:chromosome partitioning protein [Leptospira barantonii]|uniref:Chromosome partitioning protein n=1 Tax=Leptospira barantonii TaxID=2023184 RepID=A0A5F2BH32_9LEPT|nr:ParB N-terminal domain-containing protein [Leptospira barantonii]TGM04884.1 chromosome partitioning protein [Leptospira barantonii]